VTKERLTTLALIALLVISPFGGHVVMMAAMSANVIYQICLVSIMNPSGPRMWHKDALIGILLMGLIMTGLLRVILLHHAK
jgi:hypothetical protein